MAEKDDRSLLLLRSGSLSRVGASESPGSEVLMVRDWMTPLLGFIFQLAHDNIKELAQFEAEGGAETNGSAGWHVSILVNDGTVYHAISLKAGACSNAARKVETLTLPFIDGCGDAAVKP